MSKKRILIVDDEESILSVLSNSLLKLNRGYEVSTRQDGFEAISLLQREQFDMVVTDYKMAGLDGLELIEAVRAISPNTRVVLITAYGNNTIEAKARELQAFRYLAKPLELDTFRQVVQEGLGDSPPPPPELPAQPKPRSSPVKSHQADLLVLSDDRYRQISQLLSSLGEDVGARCVLLTDANGRLIAHTGDIGGLEVEELGSLMGGGMASLLEVGRALDRDEDAVNLAYREGEKEYLYALNIGQRLLLMILIDRQAYSSRLGSVWYYARQTAVNLRETLGKNEVVATPDIFLEDKIDQAFADELDKLLIGEADSAPAPPSPSFKPPIAGLAPARTSQQAEAAPTPDIHLSSGLQLNQPFDFSPEAPDLELELDDEDISGDKLFSFEEAMAQQLIPQDLWRRQS